MCIGRKRKIEQRTTQHDFSNQHPTVSLSLPFLFYVTKKSAQLDITHAFPPFLSVDSHLRSSLV